MAANDPGLAQTAAAAEDPSKGMVENTKDAGILEETHAIAPDQFDQLYETSKYEIWSWYSYYIGNNGLTLFNFAPTASQNLVSQQAAKIGGPSNTTLRFAGSERTINSIILLCNGISFAIQIVIFVRASSTMILRFFSDASFVIAAFIHPL